MTHAACHFAGCAPEAVPDVPDNPCLLDGFPLTFAGPGEQSEEGLELGILTYFGHHGIPSEPR